MKDKILKIINNQIQELRAEISAKQDLSSSVSSYIVEISQVNILRNIKTEILKLND